MIANRRPGKTSTTFVAKVDERVVGWVSAERIGTTSAADVGGINLLHVHPEHQRRGIGTAC